MNLVEQERQSLLKLRSAVIVTLETLRLWGILLEHQFSVVVATLPTNLQENLLSWNFEDLIVNRDNVSSELITSLIRFYVGDDATTVAISNRLRNSCPTLFTNDDALVVKATEIFIGPKIPKRSIQKLNLVNTCDLLIQILQFKPIVDLALARAEKDDTSKLALIAYRKQIGSADDAVNEAVRKRSDAYSCITDALELLHLVANSAVQPISSSTLSNASYLFSSADYVKKLSPANAKLERDAMIARVFESEDELAHVTVFHWLLSKGMSDVLIESRCRFFEGFLFHEIEEGKGNKYLELLWKYYEKNENYVAAAKILTDMASKAGTKANLSQRITYLSHALMCIQSAAETKANLEFKQDIQDKLDVAQIQQKTKASLESSGSRYSDQRQVRAAIEALNQQLYGLTDLYDRFGNTFDLPEVKLDVLQSAGHYEQEVIESIWKHIMNRELDAFVHGSEAESATKSKISSVILRAKKHYAASLQFVPIDFILRELLMFSFKSSLLFEWLPSLCKAAEISYSALLNVASYEYRVGDPFWKQNQRAFQFMFDMVVYVCECFKAEFSKMTTSERKILRNECLNFIAALQLDSHFGGNAQKMNLKKLDLLQTEIDSKVC
uniref:Nucleoporin Nup133/Nup155-like C-terminal domain-containing protein n=1 Tax=Ditylenchus dipsaci TaxID=166011 RepID=A0A915EQT9_9BILA